MFGVSGLNKSVLAIAAVLFAAAPALAQGFRGARGDGDAGRPHFARGQRPAPQQQPAQPRAYPQVQAQQRFAPQPQRSFAPPQTVQSRYVAPQQPSYVQQPQYRQPPQYRPQYRPQYQQRYRISGPSYYPVPVPVPQPYYEPYPVYQDAPVYGGYEEYPVYQPIFRTKRCVVRKVWVNTPYGPHRIKRRFCRR